MLRSAMVHADPCTTWICLLQNTGKAVYEDPVLHCFNR